MSESNTDSGRASILPRPDVRIPDSNASGTASAQSASMVVCDQDHELSQPSPPSSNLLSTQATGDDSDDSCKTTSTSASSVPDAGMSGHSSNQPPSATVHTKDAESFVSEQQYPESKHTDVSPANVQAVDSLKAALPEPHNQANPEANHGFAVNQVPPFFQPGLPGSIRETVDFVKRIGVTMMEVNRMLCVAAEQMRHDLKMHKVVLDIQTELEDCFYDSRKNLAFMTNALDDLLHASSALPNWGTAKQIEALQSVAQRLEKNQRLILKEVEGYITILRHLDPLINSAAATTPAPFTDPDTLLHSLTPSASDLSNGQSTEPADENPPNLAQKVVLLFKKAVGFGVYNQENDDNIAQAQSSPLRQEFVFVEDPGSPNGSTEFSASSALNMSSSPVPSGESSSTSVPRSRTRQKDTRRTRHEGRGDGKILASSEAIHHNISSASLASLSPPYTGCKSSLEVIYINFTDVARLYSKLLVTCGAATDVLNRNGQINFEAGRDDIRGAIADLKSAIAHINKPVKSPTSKPITKKTKGGTDVLL